MKTDTHLGFAIKTGLFKSIKCGLIKCCPQAEVVLMCSCNLLVLGLVSLWEWCFFFVCGFFFPPGWSVVSLHGSDDSTETCRCGRSQLLASSPQILPSGRNISEGATYAFRQIHLKFVVLKIFDNWHFIKLWMQVFSFGPVNNKHIWVGFYFTLGWCLIHLVSTVYIHVMLQIFN